MDNNGAKRVWFITDTHLGVRNNSNEWIEMISEYFYEWFIPLIKAEYKPGDVLIHLGDFYDSRQSVNLKVLSLGIDIAEALSGIFKDGIYVIAGNHDIWGKNSNDINSLKSLKWIPNFNIIEEPESLILGDKKFFMMPWRKDSDSEKETLNSAGDHDYLCCHTDIRGLSFNKHVKIDHGTEIKELIKFGTVYSGHIHYAQNMGNVKMLGSPYELTRSDMDNQKFILRLDLKTGKEKIFNNEFSPRFKKVSFDYILNKTPNELEDEFRNNFIDVIIDPIMAMRAPLNILTDAVQSQRRITFQPKIDDSDKEYHMYDSDGKQFNVIDFIEDYVKDLAYDESTKTKIITSLNKLYKKTLNQE
jgi:DNA repair exonuclease SbcCD nuclease subunit